MKQLMGRRRFMGITDRLHTKAEDGCEGKEYSNATLTNSRAVVKKCRHLSGAVSLGDKTSLDVKACQSQRP